MKYLLVLSSLALFAFTCKKIAEEKRITPTCESGNVVIKNLETEYGCVNTKYNLQLNNVDSFVVINSQPEFEAKVTGTCLPAIDFAAYTLVAGKKQLTNDNSNIQYTAIRDCNASKIHLNVLLSNTLGLSAPVVTWHCLLPKLQATEMVEVNIEVQ